MTGPGIAGSPDQLVRKASRFPFVMFGYLGVRMNNEIEALIEETLIGASPKMQQLRKLIGFAARCDSSIMISGPSGCGKEVVAQAIHSASRRGPENNIAVNCGALPEQLIESELFGHEKGSFTGAVDQHVGLFERANGGSIFLDEIGDMPLNMQVKLLRVLESRIVNRVGGCCDIPIDVRVIAATHRDLGDAIRNNSFREDLFYRLCVVPIEVPALNERTEDIPALVAHFLSKLDNGNPPPLFTTEALAAMQRYSWPGNVRELRNVVERSAVFFADKQIMACDVAALVQSEISPAVVEKQAPTVAAAPAIQIAPPAKSYSSFEQTFDDVHQQNIAITQPAVTEIDLNAHLLNEERRIILQALEASHGVVSKAARAINIKRTTLIDKMRKHSIDKDFSQAALLQTT